MSEKKPGINDLINCSNEAELHLQTSERYCYCKN